LLTKQENNTFLLPWIDYSNDKQRNHTLPLSWINDSKDFNSWNGAKVTADLISLERLPNKVRASDRPKKSPVTQANEHKLLFINRKGNFLSE
jgi:hypothetical protein